MIPLKLYIKKKLIFKYLFSFENMLRDKVLEDIIQIIVDQLTKTKLTNSEVILVLNKSLEKVTEAMLVRNEVIKREIENLQEESDSLKKVIIYLKLKK